MAPFSFLVAAVWSLRDGKAAAAKTPKPLQLLSRGSVFHIVADCAVPLVMPSRLLKPMFSKRFLPVKEGYTSTVVRVIFFGYRVIFFVTAASVIVVSSTLVRESRAP